MEKQWKDITSYFSESRRHYNGKYLLVDYLLDDNMEVQLYEVVEKGFDYEYEIFINGDAFYGSVYIDDGSQYEVLEAIKEDIYQESLKKNKYSKKFINSFRDKYDLCMAIDSYFSLNL